MLKLYLNIVQILELAGKKVKMITINIFKKRGKWVKKIDKRRISSDI